MRRRISQPALVPSHTPGRLRVNLPGWRGERPDRMETRLHHLPCVIAARANPLTGNVLIYFDPQLATAEVLLTAVDSLVSKPADAQRSPSADGPVAPGGRAVVRAGLRGLVGHALVDTVFYAVSFTQPFGLPLAGLGVLHLGFDILAWTAALAPLLDGAAPTGDGTTRNCRNKLAPVPLPSL